jgi:hypothetical protein
MVAGRDDSFGFALEGRSPSARFCAAAAIGVI